MTEAIVLAGGLGTRLRSVVSDVPKPMAPVNGRPFLELLLEYWGRQGIRRFILSVGHLAERIIDHFGSSWRGLELAYVREATPLGTGGGLLLALTEVRSDTPVVINGDTYFAVDLDELSRFHEQRQADCTVALFRSGDSVRYMGVEVLNDGRIARLRSSQGELVNGGVYLFRKAALDALSWRPGERISLEEEILVGGLRAGWRVLGREFDASFIDIGVPEDYRRATEVLKA